MNAYYWCAHYSSVPNVDGRACAGTPGAQTVNLRFMSCSTLLNSSCVLKSFKKDLVRTQKSRCIGFHYVRAPHLMSFTFDAGKLACSCC